MSRRIGWLPFLLVIALSSSGALASENFPDTIKTALAMPGPKPPCITCHDTEEGGSDTVNRPFGKRVIGYGLQGGDTQTLTGILARMREGGDDSDLDGMSDINEIIAGRNPNINDITGRPPDDYPPPVYGCRSSGARGPGASTSGGWTIAAAGLLLAHWLRRRESRRKLARSLVVVGVLVLCAVMAACQNAPLDVVDGVDLGRFQGRWYEIARLPRATQIDCAGTTADYKLTSDRELVVTNECSVGGLNGVRRQVNAAAKVTNAAVPAKLSVDFGGFFGDYSIIDLDRDGYRYAVVGHPTRQYLWILSRDPTLDAQTLAAIRERAEQKGFDTGRLEYTKQLP